MKIAVMSDLHLEFDARYSAKTVEPPNAGAAFEFGQKPPQPNADLLIVAGDVHTGALGIDWVLRHFSMPAIVIGGNHEPFGHELCTHPARTAFRQRLISPSLTGSLAS